MIFHTSYSDNHWVTAVLHDSPSIQKCDSTHCNKQLNVVKPDETSSTIDGPNH